MLVLLAVLVNPLVGDRGPLVRDDTKALLNPIVGLLLLSFALRNLIGSRHPLAGPVAGEPPHSPAVPRWMHAIDSLRPARAFGLGVVLLAISPANIAVYLSALQGLKATDVDGAEPLLLILLIVAIDLSMLIPLAIYLCMPRRAARILATGKSWLLAHQRALVSWMFFGFGVLLLASAVADLPEGRTGAEPRSYHPARVRPAHPPVRDGRAESSDGSSDKWRSPSKARSTDEDGAEARDLAEQHPERLE